MRRSRTLAAGAVMAVVVGALGLVGVTSAFAASSGTLVSSLNGKCLDVTDGSTANGNQPQMWTCAPGNQNQQWTFADNGSVQGRGKCLDIANNSTANGAVVHLWDCYDTVATQKWTLGAAGDLVNNAAGKCLDIRDNNAANGARLQIWDCAGSANQKWTFSGGATTPPTTVPTNPTNPDLGPNVAVFDPSMSAATVQSKLTSVFNAQVSNQFGNARYALLFKPGSYNVDANVGFFSWAGGSNSTAIGLYSLAFGDTNFAESTSSIVFGSGNQVKGAAGFSAGAGNRVCDTYGVALGNNAKSGGPLINGRCDPDSFNLRGLAAVAIGYNVTADQDHTTAMGKFASNNGFTGTFIWSDGSAVASADTFRNTANNEFALRATGGFRFRTNLAGTTGCNLPAGSGVFNCTSSRTTKENFTNVSSADVLSKIRKLPVSTWNYIAEGQQSRHLGPMAEDFYSTFGLGTSDKSIGIQDLAGVSLAGVKALEERTADLAVENTLLKAKLADQDQKLNSVQDQLKRQQAEIDELKKLVLANKVETDKK